MARQLIQFLNYINTKHGFWCLFWVNCFDLELPLFPTSSCPNNCSNLDSTEMSRTVEEAKWWQVSGLLFLSPTCQWIWRGNKDGVLFSWVWSFCQLQGPMEIRTSILYFQKEEGMPHTPIPDIHTLRLLVSLMINQVHCHEQLLLLP